MNSNTSSQHRLLLVKSGGIKTLPEWQEAFAPLLPNLEVKEWNDPNIDPAAVDYVFVWQPDAGRIAQYPNLKAILSTAAGVDHILVDKTVPATLPIVRMVTDDTVQRMSEFCVMSALMMLKDMPRMIHQQQECLWKEFATRYTAPDTRVGIMGLGALGLSAANMLKSIGFQVRGWSRTLKTIDGVTCFAGKDNLPAFIQETDILICLLPDTPDTRHIIDAALLAQLPQGAAVINVARGTHVDLDALITCIDEGHISRALLDVFVTEPLPESHPVWKHPRIIVTPHAAANPSRYARAKQAAKTITAIEQHQLPEHLYDRQKGY